MVFEIPLDDGSGGGGGGGGGGDGYYTVGFVVYC